MQRQRKQLLGLAGLALVGIMTAVACVISAPDAGAVGDVNVQVRVQNAGELPLVEINKFTYEDTDSVFSRVFKVSVTYSRADELKVYLQNAGAVGPDDDVVSALLGARAVGDVYELDVRGECGPITYSIEPKTCELTYNLDDPEGSLDGKYGVAFKTWAEVRNITTGSPATANEEFFFRESYLESTKLYVPNGDPVMHAILSGDVGSAYIEVFDTNNKPVKLMSNDDCVGEDRCYKLWLNQAVEVGENGVRTLDFALPMWESGVNATDWTGYKVVLITYGYDEGETKDDLNSLSTATAWYKRTNSADPGENPTDPNKDVNGPNNPNNPSNPAKPGGPGTPTNPGEPGTPGNPGDPNDPDNPDNPNDPNNPNNPDAPDTGLNLFRDLNISRADYIITGLVAFGLVTGFAIFLIVRRNKR